MSDLVSNQPETLQTFINDLETVFQDVLVNNNVTFKQEAYFAIQILEKNSYALSIAKNSKGSLKNAIVNVATIGLSLNPSMGLAYLVPRKNEICLDISYLGLIKLAQDVGGIKEVKAELVFEKDTFEINGAFKEPTHSYSPLSERGKLLGAYVVARTPSDSYLTTVMTIEEIMEIRNSSESYKNERGRKYSPWVKHEGEMIKKTVIRRAYKSWSKSEKASILDKAIEISDEAQAIEFKTEYQVEKEDLDNDFPIPPEEREMGSPEYRVQNAKFRNKQLKDIDSDDLFNYVETLNKRHEKAEAKSWELDLKESINLYLAKFDAEDIGF